MLISFSVFIITLPLCLLRSWTRFQLHLSASFNVICVYLYVRFVSLWLGLTAKVWTYCFQTNEKGEIYVIWRFNLRYKFTDNREIWKLLDTRACTHAVNFIFWYFNVQQKGSLYPITSRNNCRGSFQLK